MKICARKGRQELDHVEGFGLYSKVGRAFEVCNVEGLRTR